MGRGVVAFILIYANNMAYISRILSYFYGDARLSGRLGTRGTRGVGRILKHERLSLSSLEPVYQPPIRRSFPSKACI